MFNLLFSISELWAKNHLMVIWAGLGLALLLAIIILSIVATVSKKKKASDVATKKEKDKSETKKVETENYANIESNTLFEVVRPDEEDTSPVTIQSRKKQEEHVAVNLKDKPEEKPENVETGKENKKFVGKWIVEMKSSSEYMAKLSANNGEVMLTSEIYSSEKGARNGIQTIIKAIENGEFVIYQDKGNDYYYKLKNANNRFLCAGEIYRSKDRCLRAVESVRRIAKDATIIAELFEGEKYVDYTPVEDPKYNVRRGFEGKWRVEISEDGRYSAKLYASNGQLMLSTENVASKKSCITAIETIKKYSKEGNFVIDRDKFGRFYYKLRNSQKTVICIGEAYDKLSDCTKALESMRKFAETAIYVEE